MNDKWRFLLAGALSVEITVLGAISAMMNVTKENSLGFDVALMALGAALTTLIATWKKAD